MRRTRARCQRDARPGGTGASLAHGPYQKHLIGVDELSDQGGRDGVEEVEVVDEQHEWSGDSQVAEDGAEVGHDGDQVALPAVVGIRRQQVSEGAEGHRRRSLGGGRPSDLASGSIGHGEALVGQPRLAHAGRTMDHEAVGAGVAERGREEVELLMAAHQRPLQGQRLVAGGRVIHGGTGRAGSRPAGRAPGRRCDEAAQ